MNHLVPVGKTNRRPLSAAERRHALKACEDRIVSGLRAFMVVGPELLRIRDQELYQDDYVTFESYCSKRWELSRRRAYQLMDACQVVLECEKKLHINESQARALGKAPPELRVPIIAKLGARAPAAQIEVLAQKALQSLSPDEQLQIVNNAEERAWLQAPPHARGEVDPVEEDARAIKYARKALKAASLGTDRSKPLLRHLRLGLAATTRCQ